MDASSAPGPKWPEAEGHDTEIKKLQTDVRIREQSRQGAQLSSEPRKVRSECSIIKTCVSVNCVYFERL